MKAFFIAVAMLIRASFATEASHHLNPLEIQSTSRVLLLGSSTQQPLCYLRDHSDFWGELASRVPASSIHDLRGKPLSEAVGTYDAIIFFGGDELLNRWQVCKEPRPSFDLIRVLKPGGKGLLFVSQGFFGYRSSSFSNTMTCPRELEENGFRIIHKFPYRTRHTFENLEALKAWIYGRIFVDSTVSSNEIQSYLQRYVEFAALGDPVPSDYPSYMNIQWAIHFERPVESLQ